MCATCTKMRASLGYLFEHLKNPAFIATIACFYSYHGKNSLGGMKEFE